MPPKIRVHELSKELGLTNTETIDLCAALGIAVKTHSSSLEDAQADRVRRRVARDGLIGGERRPEPQAGSQVVARQRQSPGAKSAGGPPASPSSSGRPAADILLVLVDASRLSYATAVGFDAIRPVMGPHTKACVVTLGEGGEVLVPGQPADDVVDVPWPSRLGRPSHDDITRVIGALHEVAHLSKTPKPTVHVLDLVYWRAFGELRAAIEDFGDVTMLGRKALGIKLTEEQKDLRSDAERMLRQGPAKSTKTKGSITTGARAKPIPTPKAPPAVSPPAVPPPPVPPPTVPPPLKASNPIGPPPSSTTRWTLAGSGPPSAPSPRLGPPPPTGPLPPAGPPPGLGPPTPNFSLPWDVPQPPERSRRAVWSLVATLWCGVGTVLAVWLATTALREIKASNGRLTGAGFAYTALAVAAVEILVLMAAVA